VLDYVAQHFNGREILIAPANSFGGPVSEQAAAAAYLQNLGIGAAAPPSEGSNYIDTMGNALQLRAFLTRQSRWPLSPVDLVAAEPHASRAQLCFYRAGFAVAALHRVPVTASLEAVPPRLFYYRYPALHRLYETLALIRDRLRPVRNR
jgi:uncharacterized SAM-binding protein YcdF (DUF218 family)